VFFSLYNDLVYLWLFATYNTTVFRNYDRAMFDEIKRLYPKHCIVVSVEPENDSADNAEKSLAKNSFMDKTD